MPYLPGYPDKGIIVFFININFGDSTLRAGDILESTNPNEFLLKFNNLLENFVYHSQSANNISEPYNGFPEGIDCDCRIAKDLYKVMYFEDIEKDISKLHQELQKYQERDLFLNFPLHDNTNYSIKFYFEKQYLTIYDYHFDEMPFCEDVYNLPEENKTFLKAGHRIGGYPKFSQEDPRKHIDSIKDYELLFQLDSEVSEQKKVSIMWGDFGVGSFFIHPDDLKKRDFTNVFFSYDSY